MATAISKLGITVVGYDYRGHGKSEVILLLLKYRVL